MNKWLFLILIALVAYYLFSQRQKVISVASELKPEPKELTELTETEKVLLALEEMKERSRFGAWW